MTSNGPEFGTEFDGFSDDWQDYGWDEDTVYWLDDFADHIEEVFADWLDEFDFSPYE